jgi:hypothetical protein
LWKDNFGGQTWTEFTGQNLKSGKKINPFWIIGKLQDYISASSEGYKRRQKEMENKNKK